MRGPNDGKLSSTLTKNLSMFKFDESGRESMRVAEGAREFEAKRERESELSATLILV